MHDALKSGNVSPCSKSPQSGISLRREASPRDEAQNRRHPQAGVGKALFPPLSSPASHLLPSLLPQSLCVGCAPHLEHLLPVILRPLSKWQLPVKPSLKTLFEITTFLFPCSPNPLTLLFFSLETHQHRMFTFLFVCCLSLLTSIESS